MNVIHEGKIARQESSETGRVKTVVVIFQASEAAVFIIHQKLFRFSVVNPLV